MKLRTITLLLVLSSFLSGCGLFGGDEERDEFAGLTNEEQFYRRALEQLNGQNFTGAIATYQDSSHASHSDASPNKPRSRSSTPIIVTATWRLLEPRLIGLFAYTPTVTISTMLTMKGLASFSENSGFLNRFLPVDQTKRDPGRAQESFADFAQLIALYPDSPYAADARSRMIYLRNNLAAYEIHVANYYLERRAYIAALRRAQYVVENFQSRLLSPMASR